MNPSTLVVPDHARGERLDRWLSVTLPGMSRARIQSWIEDGHVLVDERPARASLTLRGGEQVTVVPQPLPSLRAKPEDLPLDVLYIDDDLIAVNKPSGMTVHAGAGQHSGTLVNALLHRFGQLSNISGDDRPGIVHRLDRETSGVIVVVRNNAAHQALAAQFASREVTKTYLALVQGVTRTDSGRVERPIERDPVRRTRMTSRTGQGRTALTWWTVIKRLERYTYLKVGIGTGRTHQIRVHLSSIGHPVAGDTLYGAAKGPIDRFFLHSHVLSFRHPTTNQPLTIEAPLPAELEGWLRQIP